VYQGHAGGLDPTELWRIGLLATAGLEPDLTLVLDLPLEHAAERRGARTDRMEGREHTYQQRVRDGFLIEARRRPERIRVLNADGDVDELQTRVRREVDRVLDTHRRT